MNKPTEQLNLIASLREEQLSPRAIRAQGAVPAVVYGKGIDSTSLSVKLLDFHKIYKQAGETTLINLNVADGAPYMVLIKDIQVSPDKEEYLNIDFYKVRAGEKLRVMVPLHFEGEAPAVKNFGGILVTNKNEIEIECLPQDLPHEIIVDLSKLENIDDAVIIKDLQVGNAVEILDNLEESVVVVTPPAVEEAEVEVSEAEAVASVEATAEKEEDEGEAAEKNEDKPPNKDKE
ncbi:50S ribosomal protein L25 [Patescibacteria group bacterium]|nr:50S ribosomal protein L25 [Patescibacteria group bacterium]